jgi:hypothetical protein
MKETGAHTLKAMISLGIGSLDALSITLDTGSVGLVLFDVSGIPGNGTACNGGPFSVSFGNPKRVTYSGVKCSGTIKLANVISTPPVEFGLLKKTTFCNPEFDCKGPHENYEAGNFGVFGVGIAPGVELANPLRTLPGDLGSRFMLRLSADAATRSSLILAPAWRFDAAIFPQFAEVVGALQLPTYDKGQGCVLVNGQAPSACPLVSFDTGNGVPWFHVSIPGLPTVTKDGHEFVAPETTIGITPRLGGTAAFTLTAGKTFAGEFRYQDLNASLMNVAIQAFFGHDVTFDGEQGVITVAPTNTAVAPN